MSDSFVIKSVFFVSLVCVIFVSRGQDTSPETLPLGGNPDRVSSASVRLFSDEFNYTGFRLPASWKQEGVLHDWQIDYSSFAGGQPPELRLNWSPNVSGKSHIISPTVPVAGGSRLRLSLRQYIHNFRINEGEVAGIDVIFNKGQSRETIWQTEVSQNTPPGKYEFYIDVPEVANSLQIAFRFEGDNYNIWNWYIDDVFIETLQRVDAEAISIQGNPTPSVNREEVYAVTLRNAGLAPLEDYQVVLVQQGGTELARQKGITANFTDTLTYYFPLTPSSEGPVELHAKILYGGNGRVYTDSTHVLSLIVQPEDIVSFRMARGNQQMTLPVNFLWNHSLTQSIYPASRLAAASGTLTGLQYQGNFETSLTDKKIQIWIGETHENNLKEGWLKDVKLVQVFNDSVDFLQGKRAVTIPFEKFYSYGGDNLVVLVYKEDDDWDSGNYFVAKEYQGSGFTRRTQQDNMPIDPLNPLEEGTLSDHLPEINLFFSTKDLKLRDIVADTDDSAEEKDQPRELPAELQEIFSRVIETAEAQAQEEEEAELQNQAQPAQPGQPRPASRATDGIEITEFIFNETITKLGNDFYYLFFQQWQNPTQIEGLSIYVQERPMPGMGGVVMIKVEDRMVFQAMLRPNMEQIRQAAASAVDRVRNYFVNYQQIQEQLDGDDLKGTGIF